MVIWLVVTGTFLVIQRLKNMGFQWENVRKLGEEPWINDGKLAGALEHGWIMTFHINFEWNNHPN